MGRSRTDAFRYFPHDVSASNDEKIEALTAKFGNNGYAIFFRLLERLYATRGLTLDLSSGDMVTVVARKCHTSPTTLREVVAYCTTVGLFEADLWQVSSVISCPAARRRAEVIMQERDRKRKTSPDTGVLPLEESRKYLDSSGESKQKEIELNQRQQNQTPNRRGTPGEDNGAELAKDICRRVNLASLSPSDLQNVFELRMRYGEARFGEAVNRLYSGVRNPVSYLRRVLETKGNDGKATESSRNGPKRDDLVSVVCGCGSSFALRESALTEGAGAWHYECPGCGRQYTQEELASKCDGGVADFAAA